VRHRQVGVERRRAVQREFEPSALAVRLPVQRLRQFARRDQVPALGQPQRRIAIAALLDEARVLAVGDEARGQFERPQVHAVARQFVIEAEAVAAVAGLDQAAVETQPREWRRCRGARKRLAAIGRKRRVMRQQMLEVGEHQLLVLLLVMQAERDQRLQRFVLAARCEQRADAAVHLAPPGLHLHQRGPGQQAALRARMARADAVVVRIEEIAVGRVERGKVLLVRFEHEGLEEPGRVREMPFGGARVGHRLCAAVLGRERLGQAQRTLAHGVVLVLQGARIHQWIACAWMTANQRCGSVHSRVASNPPRSSSAIASAGRYL
jgi:hypothetical protein